MQLLDTLNEINERHEAVKELNKSLVELSQMFTDMAVLVEQQGVMINNIETQVRFPCCALALSRFRWSSRALQVLASSRRRASSNCHVCLYALQVVLTLRNHNSA